jgi:hypothetical protein
LSIFGVVFVFAGLLWLIAQVNRSSFVTETDVVRAQPVPFSHEHHVGGLGIDCRYCHTAVEQSATAGIPPTATCYNCHKLIWKDSPMLEPVRASYRTGEPIHWTKVHDLPDFAYFNHSIHVAKGVGCAECHGRVDKMALMRSEHALHPFAAEPQLGIRPADREINRCLAEGLAVEQQRDQQAGGGQDGEDRGHE